MTIRTLQPRVFAIGPVTVNFVECKDEHALSQRETDDPTQDYEVLCDDCGISPGDSGFMSTHIRSEQDAIAEAVEHAHDRHGITHGATS